VALSFKEVRGLFQVPGHGHVRLRDYDPGWAARKESADLGEAQPDGECEVWRAVKTTRNQDKDMM
jgi:hypothetical protein